MTRGSARDDDSESLSGIESELDSVLRRAGRVGDELLGPPLPRPGQIVGDKYRIEERLGSGGMGAVFRATHQVSDKSVALKWMLRSTADEHARRRFLREARVAGRIDHPNVVDVYDVGEDGDCGYLVMELLRGEALRARFARGALQVSELVDLLLPAMHGVSAVHQAGVIHRDLKPDNIFLCKGPDGAPREAKVLDFGISAMTACDPNDPTLTKDGAVLGTPAYMSPEQVESARDIDARSDVYSFGVILYEGLTGQLPFDAPSYNGLILAIVHSEPKPPTELRPELPKELAAIVLRALAKRREHRYPSVESLSAALLPYASTRGAGSGTSAVVSAPRPKRAHWPLWALVGGALIAIALGLWLRDDEQELRRRPPAAALTVPAAREQKGAALGPAPQRPSTPSVLSAGQPSHVSETPVSAAPARAAAIMSPNQTEATSRPGPKSSPKKSTSTMSARAMESAATPAQKQRSGSISVDQL
jgi:serine/threonine protein kinase